jgi:putative hydrolase of the HAD superfamily
LDDTLIDRTANFGIWARAFIADLGHDPEGTELEWLVAVDRRGLTDRRELFAAVADRHRLDATVDELVADYNEKIARMAVCAPETIVALERLLAAGWRVGIVTNGFTVQQGAKIANAGLDAVVHAWVVSEEVGAAKPDPAPFRVAAERCGASPDDGWMIGDDPVNDIEGGAAAGLATIWIDHGRDWPNRWIEPTGRAAHAADAIELLLSQV